MKLKLFRISILIIYLLTALLGFGLAIYNIYLTTSNLRADPSYILLLLGFLIGGLFLAFEVFFVGKSFKEGTILLHQLVMKPKMNTRKSATLIISSSIGAVALALLILNACSYCNVVNINATPMMMEFNMFFSILIVVNALVFNVYWLFIAAEDIEIID